MGHAREESASDRVERLGPAREQKLGFGVLEFWVWASKLTVGRDVGKQGHSAGSRNGPVAVVTKSGTVGLRYR